MKKVIYTLFLSLCLVCLCTIENNIVYANNEVPRIDGDYVNSEHKEVEKVLEITTPNLANATVRFMYYIPSNKVSSKEPYPLIVFVPGLGGNHNGFHIPEELYNIANRYGFGIITPDFKFDDNDFMNQRSFQYPAAWAGDALISMCNKAKQQGLNYSKLYLVGHSAGAQFVSRFSLLKPEMIDACAVLSSGARVRPVVKTNVKYFVGIGIYDVERLENADYFAGGAKQLGMYVEYKKYPVGHGFAPSEMSDVANFFIKVKNKSI